MTTSWWFSLCMRHCFWIVMQVIWESGKGSCASAKWRTKAGSCCTAALQLDDQREFERWSSESLINCANTSVCELEQKCELEPSPATNFGTRVLIVQLATDNLWEKYAQWSIAVNSAWAQSFGHDFVVSRGDGIARETLWKSGNAQDILRVLGESGSGTWILHMDADVIILDFGIDFLKVVLDTHADLETEILVSRDETGFAGSSQLLNLGVMLLKNTAWTRKVIQLLVKRLEDNPRLTEQETFEAIMHEDIFGAQRKIKLLPAGKLNSESHSPVAYPPAMQHVVHLAGIPNQVRDSVFRAAFGMLCLFSGVGNAASKEKFQSWTLGQNMDPQNGIPLQSIFLEVFLQHIKQLPTLDEAAGLPWADEWATVQQSRRLALALHQAGHPSRLDITRLAVQRGAAAESRAWQNGFDSMLQEGMFGLGPLLWDLGEHDEAAVLFRKARARVDTKGARRLSTRFVAQENYVALLIHEKRLQEAEYEISDAIRGLDEHRKTLGDARPLSAEMRLAQVLHAQGRPVEAESTLRSSLRKHEAVLGPGHAETLRCVRALALVLKQSYGLQGPRNAASEVEKLLRRVASGFPKALGEKHPDSQRAALNLRNLLAMLQRK